MKSETPLMTHIVAGYPSMDHSKSIIGLMAQAGVSYIEIQIPFSDPIADGPTILNANQQSLKNGTSLDECFALASEMTDTYPEVRFLFMTYYNIIFNAGIEKFMERCVKAGIYGLIVPDIPPEEDTEGFFATAKEKGIAAVCVISPTTPPERLEKINELSGGLVYCTSRVGITGAGKSMQQNLRDYVSSARKYIKVPIAVGFGIDSPEKASEIAGFADIVVIGSKIIKLMDENMVDYKNSISNFLKATVASIMKIKAEKD